MSSNRLRYLEQCRQQFDDLPPEVIVKEDMLRLGVSLENDWTSARNDSENYQKKSYFIFSFDRTPIREMAESENLRAPEEIALLGGPQNFRRTIVSVRLNPASPYQLSKDESGYLIKLDGEVLCRAELPPKPSYYGRTLAGGKPITEIAPCIEWGYLIYLTVFRRCQYVGGDQECRFCDINANFDQQRDAGQPYTTVKSVEEILAALEIIAASDHRSQAYTLTGGSVTATLRGKTEADFYLEYAEAIEKRFPKKWIGKIVVQALPTEDLQKFRDAGIRIYHPNYEVWDKRLFELLCPGKNQYIGRQLWIDRILAAAKVFGPSCVIPNFVAGIEMSRPYGFETVQEAVRSTGEGLDFFMAHGITPRFTTWCPEPLSNLGSQDPAPLEYHLSLLQIYRDTMKRHRLSSPPGYGPPGIGNAVFSVSSFMDVLPPASESLVHSA